MSPTVPILLIGAVLLIQSLLLGWAGLVPGWLGACFLWLGIACLRRDPWLLGKRTDGTLALWSRLLLWPLHLANQLLWHLGRVLSKEPAVCAVVPGLQVGRRLLGSELPAGIGCVVDLTAEFAEPPAIRNSGYYRAFPIIDASFPEARRLSDFLGSLPDSPLFIHCAQGHGRTGLVAVAWLVTRGICGTAEEAESMLRAARPGIRLNRRQREFIAAFCRPAPAGD